MCCDEACLHVLDLRCSGPVNVNVKVFWDVGLIVGGLIERHHIFRGTSCLRLETSLLYPEDGGSSFHHITIRIFSHSFVVTCIHVSYRSPWFLFVSCIHF
jgi:hypothetical protein